MKRSFRNSRSASFTLAEVLVFLGVVVVLALVFIPITNHPMSAALRAKAQATTGQIQIACMSYYNDYGVYPIPTNSPAGVQLYYGIHDTNDWANLIYALCGNVNPYTGNAVTSTVPNTRSITYLTLNKYSIDANGVPLNPIAPTPRSHFNIKIDGAYSGTLTNVPLFTPSTEIKQGFITWGNLAKSGVYVWADCNPSTGYTNAGWWVHSP